MSTTLQFVYDYLASLVKGCWCARSAGIVIDGKQLQYIRLLGEGGYSYVYLVKDVSTQQEFALKKIRCPFGAESVAFAMRELESLKLFRNSSLVCGLVGSAVAQGQDDTKTVYILMPYYSAGSLQDLINSCAAGERFLSEAEVVRYALQATNALRVLHRHRTSNPVAVESAFSMDVSPAAEALALLDAHEAPDGDVALGEASPFAHRDVKPANLMFESSDKRALVLVDFGSCTPARQTIETRSEALELQDLAAQHCTLPYRAPELCDVECNSTVTEKVDIWSLGCTIYALMFQVSPFEREEQVAGASINMAIASASFSFPSAPTYSQELEAVVQRCLSVDPDERPNVEELREMLASLEEAESGPE